MATYIDSQTIGEILRWEQCIDLVELVSRHEAEGETFVSPKFNANFRGGSIRSLFAADYRLGYGATKIYHTIEATGSRYLVSLIALASGELLAILDGRRITDLRTGAASGVVARKLPFDRPVSVGVVGSGHQARAQIECLASVYHIQNVTVFSPTLANRKLFCRQLGEKTGIPFQSVSSAREAVSGRDVVVAASKARGREPVILREWLYGCRALFAVGNTRPQFLEVDHRCFEDAKLVIVDSLHAYDEAGELIRAAAEHMLPPDKRATLYEAVSGGAEIPKEGMIIFKSVGTGLQDLALAHHCYDVMRAQPTACTIPDLECSG